MKTLGTFLQDQRHNSGLTLEQVATKTKIRVEYLKAIEADDFSRLPAAAFVKGFIRNFALAVNADPEKALAVFRRDFDQNHQGKVVPRGIAEPLNTGRGFWSPRTTSLLGLGLIVLVFASYALWQMVTLVSAPSLEVHTPLDNSQYASTLVIVSGAARTDSVVRVNGQPVAMSGDGSFETEIELPQGENLIVIEAESRDGKQTQVTRQVQILETVSNP